ncbi:MAG: HK97 family phage prohead protease [Acidobacteriota bacterium]|nr:HK97 family phage prohead protease [Acidobacteriota bacterium]
MEHESRTVEIRFESDAERMSPGRLVGVLLPYGERASDRPEVFEAGALHWPADGVLLRAMHKRQDPIARFIPEATETEVRVSIELPDTTAGRDAATNVRAGVLRGLSVEFRAEKETRRDGLRVIQRARLVGAGLVDSGAYSGATVEARGKAKRRRLWL